VTDARSTNAPFEPHVPAHESAPELSFRALLLGSVLGIVFGAASTYLALRVGLTTTASVPIAVLAVWAIKRRGDQRAILEHNIVQTTGSAGESVAAAVVFTVPALIYLGFPLEVGLTTLIALTGGVLGVLMMVPLRRYLIVREHGVLRYPEGKAAAEILKAGERGGTSAKKVFVGLGIGAAWKSLTAIFGGAKGSVHAMVPGYKGAEVACEVAPELMGVGYILGWRTSVMMVAGSLLASFVLVPMIVLFGSGLSEALAPATERIADMSPGQVWRNYIRHIGAGAVATGGIFALLRALPAIWSALSASFGALTGRDRGTASTLRTERDVPLPVLLGGGAFVLLLIWLIPAFQMTFLGALLILVLGFLFSVVSSRVTGEVGSSSCPLSGMTIGVLMAICGVFLAVGWEGSAYSRLALITGAVICIAISNAGTCSQDLKTGYLLGATPVRQQGALLIGVLTSVLAVGWTSYLLNLSETKETKLEQVFAVPPKALERAQDVESLSDGQRYAFVRLAKDEATANQAEGIYLVDRATNEARYLREDGIGAGRLQAPQAKLMSVVIDGLLGHRLPWNLILIGVAIALFIELLGFRSLTFAVGVYLPLASTLPVFLGGAVRRIADLRYRRELDAEDEPEGVLYSSGVIAGASILGILSAALAFLPGYDADLTLHPGFAFLRHLPFAASDVFGVLVIAAIGWCLYRGAAASKQP
jgi:putative OPT family oligopeptide transporter